MPMEERRSFLTTGYTVKATLMVTQSCTSTTKISSKLSLTRKSAIISQKPKLHKLLSQMACKCSSSPIIKLKSTSLIAPKKLFSLMEPLSAFLLMVRRRAYSLMERFNELKRVVSKPLSLLMAKKTSSSLMEQECVNSLTAECAKPTPMVALKPPLVKHD
jgi:hypothetical protein